MAIEQNTIPTAEYTESPEIARIYDSIGDAQATIDQFDLDEQPGSAEKIGAIADLAESLSTALNELCNCEHIRDAIDHGHKGGAA